jgi:hypothetical protein
MATSVSIVAVYRLDDWDSIPGRGSDGAFLFATASLGPTHTPVPWVTGLLPRGQSDQGVKLTTHFLSRADVKNAWSYTSTPPLLLGVMLS